MKHENRAKGTRRLAIASFVLAGSLLLAACGGAGATQGSAATTAAEQPAAAAVETTATTEATAEATIEATTETTTEATTKATTEAATEANASDGADTAAAVQKLNLNTVTEEELQAAIPNFGDRMGREFAEYRPYVSIQQFRKEIGKYVDEAQVAEYEKYVYVPVKVNDADDATLQQLPGVDAAAAAELVAGRPYASNRAFLDKLAQVAPQSDVAAAAAYLEAE